MENPRNGETVRVIRAFDFLGDDVTISFHDVVMQKFGRKALFGTKDDGSVDFISVPIGDGEEKKAIAGRLRIKKDGFNAEVEIGGSVIACSVPRNQRRKAEQFLDAVALHLQKNSIYKGRAFSIEREFLDLSAVSLEQATYSAKSFAELNAHLWSLIEKPDRCQMLGVELSRRILLSGVYGAGKTLTALITAKKAVEHGWTFVYMPPTSKWGYSAMRLTLDVAKRCQPAVVFMEDIDHEQRKDDAFSLHSILGQIDGITSKGAKLIIVMTTNNHERLVGGMQRPGRVDKIINLGFLDRQDIQKLIYKTVPPEHIDPGADWEAIIDSCKDYPPAFVKEVAKSAALTAIGRDRGVVTSDMLTDAARDLRGQFEACERSLRNGQYL